jgi:Zn-dependent peptidase ImmA (M78 family)
MPDPQGDYNIYINSALSEEQQRRSLLHELRHIRRDDFFRKDASARQLEAETRSSRD